MPPVLHLIRVIPREETSDTIKPAKPFAPLARPLQANQPERFKSQSTLFNEDACDAFLDILFNKESPLHARISAASGLGSLLKKIDDEKRISDAIFLLKENMLDDSEHTFFRVECGRALALCGRLDAAIALGKVLNGIPHSVFSKLLAVRGLSLQRGDYALNALMDAVEFGSIPEVRFAAAMELASMGLARARQAAAHFIATTRYSEDAMKVREALSSGTVN